MTIDRCYCQHVLFSTIKACAEEAGADLDAVCAQTGCGRGCGLCLPYIRIVLRTGRTDLPVMSPDDADQIGAGETTLPPAEDRGADTPWRTPPA